MSDYYWVSGFQPQPEDTIPEQNEEFKRPFFLIGSVSEYDEPPQLTHIDRYATLADVEYAKDSLRTVELIYRKLFSTWFKSIDKSLVSIEKYKEYYKYPRFSFANLKMLMENGLAHDSCIEVTNEQNREILGQKTFFDIYSISRPVSYGKALIIMEQ